jgi:hypothetical protein
LCSPGSSCVALQLQLYLLSSSLSKVGQFSFECCPLFRDQLWDPLPAMLGKIGLSPHPSSQPLSFPDLCLLVAPLGGWLVSPLSLSAFMSLPISAGWWWLLWDVGLLPCSCSKPLLLYPHYFTKSLMLRIWLLAHPCSPRQGQCSTPTSAVSVRLQFAVYIFQF